MNQILTFFINESFSERHSLFIGSLTTLHVTRVKVHVVGYPEYRDELTRKERGGGGVLVPSCILTLFFGGTE
jgi:hypothetical protein